jgi:hypothetical protein
MDQESSAGRDIRWRVKARKREIVEFCGRVGMSVVEIRVATITRFTQKRKEGEKKEKIFYFDCELS